MNFDDYSPLVRQLCDADGDRVRARILLSLPDAVLFECAGDLIRACTLTGFDVGRLLILIRVTAMRSVRDEDGLLRGPISSQLAELRDILSAFASGRINELSPDLVFRFQAAG